MSTQEANAGEALAGGREVKATLATGKTEDVLVRQLPVGEWNKAADAMFDDMRFVELVCNRPPGWATSLAPASMIALAQAAEDVNRDFFVYAHRRMKRIREFMPDAIAGAVNAAAGPGR